MLARDTELLWTKVARFFTLRVVFFISLFLRVSLLVYGEWQDATFAVKFTDVDYHVFNDAAGHVASGRSPYLRPTYRYTPLLALLLTLNHYLFFSFGKLVFIGCDICAGILIHQILALRGVRKDKRAFSVALWLLNPLTATVSSRGNAESVVAVLVLFTLYLLMCHRITCAAVLYGLAVHMKIYPIIYSLPLYLFIGEDYTMCTTSDTRRPLMLTSAYQRFLSPQRLKFAYTSLLAFFSITALCYLKYGEEFIEETYLYHITRRDIKHNFSVYFYMLYLIQDTSLSAPAGILAFVPQAVLLLAASVMFYRDLPFCCFVQTFIFVTFNKVCTSQYFLWYLCLLPMVTPYSKLSAVEALKLGLLWFLGQGVWLFPAYLLEFQGYNTLVFIWLAGLFFFAMNVYVLVRVLSTHDYTPFFTSGRIVPAAAGKKTSKLQ